MKKKILSLLMAVCMILTSLVLAPASFSADSLFMDDHFGMFGAHLRHKSSITQNINDKGQIESYTLEMEIYANYAVKVANKDFLSATDDYYVVDRPGRYLVELWGGDGASVTSEGDVIGGGIGGYVYGIINLEVGDVLVYTLGGAGQVSGKLGEGGGANGGGGYGTKGSTAVGGGGGYSAVYLFRSSDKDELDRFYANYVDESGQLTEAIKGADRLSKYVMIAGGGGGAGAAKTESRGSASGGAGGYVALQNGTIVSSTSGTLNTSDGYAVTGSFYAGLSGNSIDGTGDYAGKGGSYLPGKVVSTVWGWGSGDQPNDWVGSQNQDLEGGAGGAGNYRGGGGGAGFCGGSGGVMSNIVLATGVGGGGGGSSFIAISEDLFRINVDVERDREFIVGREKTRSAGEENTALGGRFHIVYLDEQEDAYLEDLNIEFARTPFFNLTGFTATNVFGDGRESKTYEFMTSEDDRDGKINIDYAGYLLSTNKEVDAETEGCVSTLAFKIPHVSLKPTEQGYEGDYLKLTLTFTPKPDFAGGNNVPLFAGDVITVSPAGNAEIVSEEATVSAGDLVGHIYMKNFCGYVNVPLKLDPAPVNHTPQGLDPGKVVHPVSSLYIDKYASVREDLSSDFRTFFLEEISTHTVLDEERVEIPLWNGNEENTVSPDETTRYFVSITATPKVAKKPYAQLGEVSGVTTFTGVSVITIAGTGMDALGENMLVYQKDLKYSDGKYILSLHVTSDSSGSIEMGDSKPSFLPVQYGGGTANGQQIGYTSKVTIPIDGVYTITLKGGNGGRGGSSLLFDNAGGNGGQGGSLQATFKFKAGTVLAFVAGANAEDTSTTKAGGAGGSPSYVAVCDPNNNSQILYYLMIAAGGGGGGGSVMYAKGGAGESPNSKGDPLSKEQKTPDDFKGRTGEAASTFTAGDGGTAVANYVYQVSDGSVTYQSHQLTSVAADAPLGGTGSMVCDGIGGNLAGSANDVGHYTIDTAISKYFEVEDVTINVAAGNGSLDEGDYTVVKHYDKDTVANGDAKDYEYSLVSTNVDLEAAPLEGSEAVYVDFTLSITLSPRENFLGGNDVKLIEPAMATTGLFTGMKIAQSYENGESDYIDVGENRVLDYANVAIDQGLLDKISLEVEDKTYVYGDTLTMADFVTSVTLPGLSAYNWEADYVKLIDPKEDTTVLYPSGNETYTITAGVGPLYEDPYATVRSPEAVTAVVVEKTATVYTDFSASFDLYHIQLDGVTPDEDGRYLIPFGPDGEGGYIASSNYVFTLEAEELGEGGHNHHLPKKITITSGGKELVEGVDYEYDRGHDNVDHATVATVTVYNTSIDGNLVVSAEACSEHHLIYYVYQSEPESSQNVTVSTEKHYSEHVDAATDFALAQKELPVDTYEHYTLVWDYGNLVYDEEEQLHIMPKGDAWVTGIYQPNPYTVTVTYLYEDGTEAAPAHVENIPYNQTYLIASPAIAGKLANQATVSGRVTGDVEITVTYSDATGILTIYYVYADGSEAAPSYTKELTSGEAYEVASPSIRGFETEELVVSGVMGDYGAVHTVTYTPKTFVITFDANGGSCSLTEKTVEYGNIYSYDAQSGTYETLPTPIKLGSTFNGWKLDNGIVIRSGDTVSITKDCTVRADWIDLEFTVTVEYVTDLGVTVSTNTEKYTVGDTYTIQTPRYLGHTPDKDVIEGKMPAQNLLFVVTYTRNTYTVTVLYHTPTGDVEQKHTLLHGESYHIIPDPIEGYVPSIGEISGTINAQSVSYEVTYYSTAISVSIEWGAMDFTYELGLWDPLTHTYGTGAFYPENNSNSVTVTNTSQVNNTKVTVGFVFYPAGGYPGVRGYYTSDQNGKNEVTSVTLNKKGNSTTAYLWLTDGGQLGDFVIPDSFVVGRCSIILN